MFPSNTWCFDLEIVNAIPTKDAEYERGIRYCNGWGDHAGMGVSVLVAERLDGTETRVFIGAPVKASELQTSFYWLGPTFRQFMDEADLLIGYGSRQFDAKVLAAMDFIIPPKKHFDFLLEIKKSLNNYAPKGFKLGDLSVRCGGPAKREDGAMAPFLWQRGEKQRVVNYCTGDAKALVAICHYYVRNGWCVPDGKGGLVKLRTPTMVMMEG